MKLTLMKLKKLKPNEALLRRHGAASIPIAIIISFILLFLIGGSAAVAFSFVRKYTGETPYYTGASSSACYMPDANWTNASSAELPDAKTAIAKLGKREVLPSEADMQKILDDVRAKGVNPAVAIATWGKEQNFGNRDYSFGAAAKSSFERQLQLHIGTLVDARDNTGSYGNRPSGTTIQKWWIDTYTPASDKRNDVEEDRTIFFYFLKLLVPGQIVCPQATSSFGPDIIGKYYPPLGDKMSSIRSYNSSPHGSAGHGLFISSLFGDYENVYDGAIDYNTQNGSRIPVYASFEGTIVHLKPMHNSTYGHGGGILFLKGADGTSGAIYAHITFASGITEGMTVTKQQQLGYIAPHCGNGVSQCVTFNGSEHLHFQFYINKKGLSKKQLIELFSQ